MVSSPSFLFRHYFFTVFIERSEAFGALYGKFLQLYPLKFQDINSPASLCLASVISIESLIGRCVEASLGGIIWGRTEVLNPTD